MESQLRRLKPGKLIFIGLLSLMLASTSIIQLAFSCSNFRDARPTVSRRLRNYFRHPIAVICRRRLNGVIALSIKDLVLERVLRPEAARGGFRIAFCFREHVSQ